MLYFISNFVYTVCRTGVALTKPLLFIRRGTSAAEVGFLVAYFAFAVMLTRFIIGVVSDKVGVKPILISAFILSGLIKIAYVTAPVYSFGVFSFLDGITHGCFMAVRGPILYSISDSQNRGSYFGKMTAFSNVAGFVASIAAGYLFESINETVFYFALGAVLICTGIVLFYSKHCNGAALGLCYATVYYRNAHYGFGYCRHRIQLRFDFFRCCGIAVGKTCRQVQGNHAICCMLCAYACAVFTDLCFRKQNDCIVCGFYRSGNCFFRSLSRFGKNRIYGNT